MSTSYNGDLNPSQQQQQAPSNGVLSPPTIQAPPSDPPSASAQADALQGSALGALTAAAASQDPIPSVKTSQPSVGPGHEEDVRAQQQEEEEQLGSVDEPKQSSATEANSSELQRDASDLPPGE